MITHLDFIKERNCHNKPIESRQSDISIRVSPSTASVLARAYLRLLARGTNSATKADLQPDKDSSDSASEGLDARLGIVMTFRGQDDDNPLAGEEL